MKVFVLDTNIFINTQAKIELGTYPRQIVQTISELLQSLKGEVSCFMVPRAFEELRTFFKEEDENLVQNLALCITLKSPDINSVSLPAALFADYLEEMRVRNYRGMQVAEEQIAATAQNYMGSENLDKIAFQKSLATPIQGFRQRYRKTTRWGILDSLADLESILLAKELGAELVTTDEGLIKWSRKMGVAETPPDVFGRILKSS